jgi:hypothetical protein
MQGRIISAHLIAWILPEAHFTPARLSSPFHLDHEALSYTEQHNTMMRPARRTDTAVPHSNPIHQITQTPANVEIARNALLRSHFQCKTVLTLNGSAVSSCQNSFQWASFLTNHSMIANPLHAQAGDWHSVLTT